MIHPRLIIGIVLSTFIRIASATTYDLASDWSDTNNPNGTWAYGLFDGNSFGAFSTHVNSYINVGPPAFKGPQPAWTSCADTGNNGCPQGLAKSIGIALLDFPAGKVGGHTPLNGWLAVQWTAPSDGTATVTGDTWMWRNIGRTLITTVLFNNVQLFSPVTIPSQTSGITSSNPYTFAEAAKDSGAGSSVLQGITVHAGDTLTWVAARAPGSVEDFAGVDMTVNFAPVPEPSAWMLMLLGLPLVALLYRRAH